MNEINKPKKRTYFICTNINNEVQSYGFVDVNQRMSNSHYSMKTYTVKSMWEKELNKLKVKLK